MPAGHLAALVGPNGAGKTTLMNMTAGLAVPTTGTTTVLEGRAPGSPAALDGVAFVAQDAPVYRNLTVYTASVFDSRPVAFAAWTLAAFTISAFLGMLFRRIIPAMAVTLGVYLGLALLVWDVRKFYPLSLVSSNPSIGSGRITPGDPWVVSQWFTGHGGQPVSQSVVNRVVAHSQIAGPRQLARVLTEHGYTAWTRYIPVSRFWPVQLVEAGWLLVLSVLLVAATVWLVRRRAA